MTLLSVFALLRYAALPFGGGYFSYAYASLSLTQAGGKRKESGSGFASVYVLSWSFYTVRYIVYCGSPDSRVRKERCCVAHAL